MWKEILNALRSLLALYLLACFIALIIAAGMLLLPVAMLIVAGLAIKEVATSRRRSVEVYVPIKRVEMKKEFSLNALTDPLKALREYLHSVEQKWSYYWHRNDFTVKH